MDHLKTFEAYIKYHSLDYPEDKDLIKMFGISRQTIEDLLVDIEDKLSGIHISIEFLNYSLKDNFTEPFGFINWRGDVPYDHNSKQIDKTKMVLLFCPSLDLLKSLESKDIRGKSWYEIITDGVDLTDDILALKKRLELIGFYDIEVQETKATTIQHLIDAVYFSQGVQHGQFFLKVYAKKDLTKR